MTMVDDADTLGEYHARQRANMAEGDAASAKSALWNTQSRLRNVRKRLERALGLLAAGDDSAARSEIQAALNELGRL